jgi:O-antigen/teichoic acid export membrane protein
MIGKILGYVPSTLIPAIVSLLMLYAYTRILTPAMFGEFIFVFSGVLLVSNSVFFAVPVAVTRFYGGAVGERASHLLAQCYMMFFALSGCLILCAAGASLFLSFHSRLMLWLGVGLVVVRSGVMLSQSIRRVADQTWQYNIVECTQAVLGLALGLGLLLTVERSAVVILFALLVAGLACMVPGSRWLLLPFKYRGNLGGPMLARLMAFAWPTILMDATITLWQLSDRFLLHTLGGAEALGIYAVAYNLVERPTTLLCGVITTATFPMAVSALQSGRDASVRQSGRNGAALLTLAIPACVGIALTSPNLVATLLGPQFRAGAVALVPIMCFTALLRGLSTHFIDHAFYLSERPARSLWVYGPAAAVNIALNLLLIPRFGAMGAAYAGLISQGGAVVFGWLNANKVFPVQLPASEIIKIVAAVAPMALLLSYTSFPLSWAGLFQAVLLGVSVFVLAGLAVDIGGSRRAAFRSLRRVGH